MIKYFVGRFSVSFSAPPHYTSGFSNSSPLRGSSSLSLGELNMQFHGSLLLTLIASQLRETAELCVRSQISRAAGGVFISMRGQKQ